MIRPNGIVLTGFEPFDGAVDNPSWDAVQIAEGLLRQQYPSIVIERLAVEFGRATNRIIELFTEHQPAVFIATGVAGRAKGLRLESLAVNLIDATIPDNAGVQPRGVPVRHGAPDTFETTLPRSVTEAWTAAAIPWEYSADAGRYVCNAAFFTLQHAACDAAGAAPSQRASATGFIHVPPAAVVPVVTSGRAIAIAAQHAVRAYAQPFSGVHRFSTI